MNKVMLLVLMTSLFTSSAFAMGKGATKEEKAFGNCQVEAPKTCGSYRPTMTKEEYKKYQACTESEWKKCWEVFKK